MPDLPKDITDVDKIDPVQGESKTSVPDQNAFKEQMQQADTNPAQKGKAPSPMDIANTSKIAPNSPPTLDQVQSQMNSVSGSLGDIKNQLHTKNLKLKSSEKYLIRKKLGNANDHLKHAAKNVGVDNEDDEGYDAKLGRSKNPIARFLSMVSDGQHQMVQAAQSINKLNSDGKSINPGQLLLVQIKLQKAQQELNYTTVILGNATSMIKTLMNTQI
ncbi:MAG: hypothetical protein S4CHLAM20_07370 [Chlamydiia bacterium]|nr:hypothetical protein [Chlamydiia bacterium]